MLPLQLGMVSVREGEKLNINWFHEIHCEKGSAEVVLPSSTEKVQPATGAGDSFTQLLLSRFCALL